MRRKGEVWRKVGREKVKMMGRDGERRQMRVKQSTAHASFSNGMQIPVFTLLSVSPLL